MYFATRYTTIASRTAFVTMATGPTSVAVFYTKSFTVAKEADIDVNKVLVQVDPATPESMESTMQY